MFNDSPTYQNSPHRGVWVYREWQLVY